MSEQTKIRVMIVDDHAVVRSDEVKGAVDNLETSIGSDGLPAAIRNLVSVAEKCVEAFNQRAQVITGGTQTASQ